MKPANDYHRLRKFFHLATSVLAARAYGCPGGTCPPPMETTEVYTPPGNGPDAGDDKLPELTPDTCARMCNGGAVSCRYGSTDAGGAVTVLCMRVGGCSGAGRRPEDFPVSASGGPGGLGGWLAEMATLEAASIRAFRTLEAELAAHGAPRSLRRRAREAAADEVRHARSMARFARKYAGSLPRTRPARERGTRAPRSLLAMALENAVEGCARETFGALLAEVIGRSAQDRDLGEALRQIARDETRHASLAHAVRRWLDTQLTPTERAEVDGAYRAALDRLEDEAPVFLTERERELAGIPEPAALRALARTLADVLRRSGGASLRTAA